MTHRLNVLYKYMNISNDYQVIEGTRNSITNDQSEITPKHPKQSYRFVHESMSHCILEVYEVSTK